MNDYRTRRDPPTRVAAIRFFASRAEHSPYRLRFPPRLPLVAFIGNLAAILATGLFQMLLSGVYRWFLCAVEFGSRFGEIVNWERLNERNVEEVRRSFFQIYSGNVHCDDSYGIVLIQNTAIN